MHNIYETIINKNNFNFLFFKFLTFINNKVKNNTSGIIPKSKLITKLTTISIFLTDLSDQLIKTGKLGQVAYQ